MTFSKGDRVRLIGSNSGNKGYALLDVGSLGTVTQVDPEQVGDTLVHVAMDAGKEISCLATDLEFERDYGSAGWAKPPTAVKEDVVNNPKHYTSHPSGIECIQITEHMNFNLGNALKYVWRADLKGKAVEDLKKAEFYIKRELKRLDKQEKV
tara:strand:+ start:598 stop:1053 length:456 start_codon:yes stop_codon:yes gene_type:complete